MKKVNLSEEAYKKLINEISYGLVDKSDDVHYEIFYEMKNTFSDFYDTVKYNADTNNPYVKKIKEYADAIKAILDRKENQATNFGNELNKFDQEKFYGDKERPEDMEDFYNVDLRALQQKYPK